MNYKNKINKINNIIDNTTNNNSNQIITKNGYKCLGPCMEANKLFYHPITFQAIITKYPVCPIYDRNKHDPKNKDEVLIYDKCNIEDNNKINYKKYNIFDDNIYFCNSKNDFLVEVYNIKNIIDIINFFNDNFNELPIYTQKRLLNYIYDVYISYNDFPFELFSDKLIDVFNKIYKIKLNNNKIIKKIKTTKINNLFIYLLNKYTK